MDRLSDASYNGFEHEEDDPVIQRQLELADLVFRAALEEGRGAPQDRGPQPPEPLYEDNMQMPSRTRGAGEKGYHPRGMDALTSVPDWLVRLHRR